MRGQTNAACCLQECGAVPASATLVGTSDQNVKLCRRGGTSTRPSYWITWCESDPYGGRCNLAMILLTDDLDGSEPAESVEFGIDGRLYSIDLSAAS